ncbi:cholecystokinin receptor type A-like isoform X1 [Daphnia pulicaria]|uniref:cholecystokinin receptor type A-like isoform X1 n=1 Tax=Daphnia pulicaria TaxID=35523 RepID=UPI001EEAC747|nr:cholecystokinin receptor type A-like isoform X1 [Daphnia pulicaria]
MMSAVGGDERLTEYYEPIFLLLLGNNNSRNDSLSNSGSGGGGNNNNTTEEDYDYDIDSSFDNYDWAELIPAVVVYSFVLLFGISGNGLIIFTIARYRRLKTITNIFLASLASADLLLVIICVPVNVAKLFSFAWTFGVFLCKFVHYMQNVSAICSVLTLTAMSIERYYAIVHPMRAQYLCTLSQARKVITATWITSFTLATPTLWIQVHLPVGVRKPAFWCVRDWDSPISWQIYELYMFVLVLVLPLSIMAGTYGAIGREVWRVTYLRSSMTNDPNTEVVPAAMLTGNVATATAISTTTTAISSGEVPADLPDVVGPEACQMLNEVVNKREASSARGLPTTRRTAGVGGQQNKEAATAVAAVAAAGAGGKNNSVKISNTILIRRNKRRSSSNHANSSRSPPASQRAQADHKTARQVVKMLVAVVILFAVCWSPYLIDNVLTSFAFLPTTRTGPMKHMKMAFHLLSYINSCCNPLVYGFMSKNFRRGFKAALRLRSKSCIPYFCYCCTSCCCCHRNPRNVRQRSVYKFSHVSNNSRLTTQIRLQDPGYVRSSTVGHSSIEATSAI